VPQNDYTTDAMVERITLKAYVSQSTSLTPQQILDLANDSLRSYVVPLASTLREEWWVGKSDIVRTSAADGSVTVPDSVASTLRTVAWNNAGILTPLSRVEPESSFQYLPAASTLPLGFELRGYTLFLMPPTPGIEVHLTAMLRPPQMVLGQNAAKVASQTGPALTLVTVPLEWQETTPTQVDVVSGVSPFSRVDTFGVVSLVGKVLTLSSTPTISGEAWVSDVDTSPFANVPIELYPLLELDVVATLFQGLGDKRLKGILDRKKELESFAKRTMGPRTSGNARPIVNGSAPGMRSMYGWWPRR
jgi:hypothetical protein